MLRKVAALASRVSYDAYKILALTIFSGGSLSVLYAYNLKTKKQYAMISEQNYYKDAVEILKDYSPAISLLGEPVTAKKISYLDPESVEGDELNFVLKIPVVGSKGKGNLFTYVSRETQDSKYTIDRLDFEQYSKLGCKRWTFFISKDKMTSEMKAKQQVLDNKNDVANGETKAEHGVLDKEKKENVKEKS